MALRLPTLSKSVFNPALHKSILNLWFQDLPPTGTTPTEACARAWFGVGATSEEKKAFDSQCRATGGAALAALGPDQYPLPPWKSYEEDTRLAPDISRPLRQVVHEDGVAASVTGSDQLARADVARALVILLDQLSRNVFRDASGQRLVYTHYDRLSRALVAGMQTPPGNEFDVTGLDTALHAASPARRVWMAMPLMHSEHLAHHDGFSAAINDLTVRARAAGDTSAVQYVAQTVGFEAKHRALLERFGRYPHRNAVMEREMTVEEREYLAGGGETFGTA